jgi:hypothetical protein
VKKKLLSDEELGKLIGQLIIDQMRLRPDEDLSHTAYSPIGHLVELWAQDPESYNQVEDTIERFYPSKKEKARRRRALQRLFANPPDGEIPF